MSFLQLRILHQNLGKRSAGELRTPPWVKQDAKDTKSQLPASSSASLSGVGTWHPLWLEAGQIRGGVIVLHLDLATVNYKHDVVNCDTASGENKHVTLLITLKHNEKEQIKTQQLWKSTALYRNHKRRVEKEGGKERRKNGRKEERSTQNTLPAETQECYITRPSI